MLHFYIQINQNNNMEAMLTRLVLSEKPNKNNK